MKTAPKQFILVIVFCLFWSSTLFAQSPLLDVGTNFGVNFPIGKSKYFNSYTAPSVRFYLIYNYFSNLNLKFQFCYSKIGKIYQNSTNWISVKSADLMGVYFFSNKLSVRPFLQFGFGLMNYNDNISASFNEGAIIGGVGMKIPMNPHLSFIAATDLRSPFGDNYPGLFSNLEDIFFSLQSGFEYHFHRAAKTLQQKSGFKLRQFAVGEEAQSSGNPVPVDSVQLENVIRKNAKIKEQIVNQLDSTVRIQDAMIDALAAKVKMLLQQNDQLAEKRDDKQTEQQIPDNYLQIGRQYQLALDNYNAKNFKAAILILSDLKKWFPYHPLASNFVYWIGESYYAMKNYPAAIAAFEEVENYEISAKKDDSLLMAGICYTKLRNYEKANQLFQKLIQYYPRSEYVDKTKRYLSFLANK